ncbi:hypothetical protein NIES2100_63180 [Calothrix sp. NIES-2100]|uniref:hypothetical protein n=1 Tax=Calothrix sp. NIES-2100 TaxID=1954172 RepID=UPI000B5ED9DE|nr:hypothetical protein NIES2100_63180 [Calothrix sp. NIES-2100]
MKAQFDDKVRLIALPNGDRTSSSSDRLTDRTDTTKKRSHQKSPAKAHHPPSVNQKVFPQRAIANHSYV